MIVFGCHKKNEEKLYVQTRYRLKEEESYFRSVAPVVANPLSSKKPAEREALDPPLQSKAMYVCVVIAHLKMHPCGIQKTFMAAVVAVPDQDHASRL